MDGVWIFVALVAGLFLGAVGGYLVARVRTVAAEVGRASAERERDAVVAEREALRAELRVQQEQTSNVLSENARLAEQLRQESELRAGMRKESELMFREIATAVLDEKSRTFKESNESRLKEILTPFNQNIDALRKVVHDCYTGEVSEVKSLRDSIKELTELNTTIGREAKELSGALRGNSKVQGDWGEMMLQRILERSGLEEGVNYTLQATTNTDGSKIVGDDNNLLRPDALFYLPDDKSIVIDSKTNIKHYISSLNASESEREALLDAHVRAVYEQVKNLASKEYSKHVRNAADFVMMFIPNEGAYIAAMQRDAELWEKAYDRHIVIVSPTHLISVLKLMYQLWTRDKQTRNALKIAAETGKLYDKLAGFVKDLQDVGSALAKASTVYDQAYKKLSTGHGNILSKVEGIKQLGVKTTKSLPQHEVEE